MSSLPRTPAPAALPPTANRGNRTRRPLVAANALLLLAVALHATLDATNRWSGPTGLPIQLWVAATGLVATIALALTLALRGDRRAPAAAMLAGFAASIGGLIAHAGPPWGPLTQFSFWAPGAHTDTLSWVLLTTVFLTGLGLGLLGLKARSTPPNPRTRGAR